MLHDKRVWCLSTVATAVELAEKLTSTTWCCCSAFQIAEHPDYIWLNDATSEDGAQEYAVVKVEATGEIRQIESITFSWCTHEKAIGFIHATLEGKDDAHSWSRCVTPQLQTPQQHGRCPHCA